MQIEDSLDAVWMNVPWHMLTPSDMRLLLPVMAQKVFQLKAAGLYSLTFEGYKTLMKDIYSQLTVLQSLVEIFG